MCPNKGWFFNFEKLNDNVVCMGQWQHFTNNWNKINFLKVSWFTRVLTDVRYIPNLKKNIISLGVLEFKDFTIIMWDRVLKIVSGALVLIKGIKKNNLYYLQGNTVIRAIATISWENKDYKIARLWHMHLWYPSEKALQNLVKQGLLKGDKINELEFYGHYVLRK